jgi:hypothetical protein
MKHTEVQNALYDFLQHELSEEESKDIEHHLVACKACTEELHQLRHALALLPSPSADPAEGKGKQFFDALALRVEREIRERRAPRKNSLMQFIESVRLSVRLRPSYAYAFGGTLAVVVFALLFVARQPERHAEYAGNEEQLSDYELAHLQTQQRMSNYLQKSKTLLVGIANMKQYDRGDADFSAERKLSRNLVHEARFLKSQPMDERSAKLLQDLQKILIELANLEETNDVPNVEMIRSGINQENLLFKIRMAETSFDTNRTTSKIY